MLHDVNTDNLKSKLPDCTLTSFPFIFNTTVGRRGRDHLVVGFTTTYTRRVWRYQRGSQNPYIEEQQTTLWEKEKVRKDKQRSIKHTHKTKDRVTRTPRRPVPITTDVVSSNLDQGRCTTLCDNVCQWLSTGRCVFPGPPDSSTNKPDRHDMAKIFLKVALSIIKQTNKQTNKQTYNTTDHVIADDLHIINNQRAETS